jgi:hypothetical protein
MMFSLIKNDDFARFVPCANGVGLLKISPQADWRRSNTNAHPVFPGGGKFPCDFQPSITSKLI